MKLAESSIENLINIRKNVYFANIKLSDKFTGCEECSHVWKMIYVRNGSLAIQNKNAVNMLYENEIAFFAPNEFWKPTSTEDRHLNAFCFLFVCDSKAMNFFRGYREKLSEASVEIMKKLIEEGKHSFVTMKQNGKLSLVHSPNMMIGGPQMYKIYLESLLINILREHKQLTDVQNSSVVNIYENVCSKVCDYLADNVYANISIDDLCRKFNYSSTFLCTRFKECMGISIMQYYTSLKIKEACNLIKADKCSVTEISEILNYSHTYSFSRAFKRVVGTSPQKYKEKLSEKNNKLF